MSVLTNVRKALGAAGFQQSSTVDRVNAAIEENNRLKAQIAAALREAKAHGAHAETVLDAVRMLCRGTAPARRRAAEPARARAPRRKAKAKAKAPAPAPRRRPPVLRLKSKYRSKAAALRSVRKAYPDLDLVEGNHSATRWVWKVKA